MFNCARYFNIADFHQAYAKLEDELDPIVVAIVPGRHHVPTTVTIVDVRLMILDSNLRRGLPVGMPGALNSTSPAVPTASPGLSVSISLFCVRHTVDLDCI